MAVRYPPGLRPSINVGDGGAASVSGVGAMVEAYADLAQEILGRPVRLGRSRLVAVDGPSGAGQTVFAGRLAGAVAAALGVAAPAPPVVRTDDLLHGWADQFTFWPRLDDWVLSLLWAGRPGKASARPGPRSGPN